MSVGIEKLRSFQQQHLETQVQCGEEIKSVPKAGCVKEWALVEIALNLRALNEKIDRLVREKATTGESPVRDAESNYRSGVSGSLPTS